MHMPMHMSIHMSMHMPINMSMHMPIHMVVYASLWQCSTVPQAEMGSPSRLSTPQTRSSFDEYGNVAGVVD